MFVAASTDCYRDLSFEDAIDRIVDVEYTTVEVSIHEDGNQLKPSEVAADLHEMIERCLSPRRTEICAYSVRITETGEAHYDQFEKICQLAKATKVVTLVVPSSELGTPFNEEVEHLRKLVDIARRHGVRVGMQSRIGCLTEDPDTVTVMCDHVKGLGLTLDPSHYLCGPHSHRDLKPLMKYVYHVQLRDSKKNQLDVQIGQGEIDYGKLISQLRGVGYDRALTASIIPLPGLDYTTEMRKMRLLLESLLL
ncbi:MAG TPA: sugar phosphate isomerase/epimerase [Pirellulaceae bacterium]|nr:sugar phosphate isomerase/epimerase [Pirellulaceae bacterium]